VKGKPGQTTAGEEVTEEMTGNRLTVTEVFVMAAQPVAESNAVTT
jgi:hypothetical protein